MDPSSPSIPLKLADEKVFAIAREFLAKSGFDQSNLCPLLGMDDMSDLGKVQWEKLDATKFSPALWATLQVFLRGNPVPRTELLDVWGQTVLDAFCALGLVRPARKNPRDFLCPVWLYPALGCLIASDRRTDPENDLITPYEDVVFPGIYAGTLRFLRLLPDARGGEALDLCGGTGIGALLLARTAGKSATADLTERSALFADFNGRLTGVPIESLCGDLYAPARGRQFDLITAHPPFVPATGKMMIYRDAGATGEDVTQGVITGLAEHLRPGGTAMVLCVACDTFEAPFEQRAFGWLGEKKNDFDVIYGLEKILTVEGVVASMTKRGHGASAEEVENLTNRLRSANTRQFVYGALFLRRRSGPHGLAPLRFRITHEATAADFERMFAWREWVSKPGLQERILESKPKLHPGVELKVRHVVDKGDLIPAEFVFVLENTIEAALRPDPWVVPLLAQFNGTRSVREVFDRFQAAGELPTGFPLEAFAGLVKNMMEKGFFEVPSSEQQP